MDCERKIEGGTISELAFDVSPVCPRVRSLNDLTSQVHAMVKIELGQGGARLEYHGVT